MRSNYFGVVWSCNAPFSGVGFVRHREAPGKGVARWPLPGAVEAAAGALFPAKSENGGLAIDGRPAWTVNRKPDRSAYLGGAAYVRLFSIAARARLGWVSAPPEPSRFCYRCGAEGSTYSYLPPGSSLAARPRWMCKNCRGRLRRRDDDARQMNLFHPADVREQRR